MRPSPADQESPPESATLVAIAKNEAPYLLEWITYHLSIGFSRITIYDNESTDGSAALLERIAEADGRVAVRFWASDGLYASPQATAYNDALGAVATAWVMFLDIDEFLVPFRDGSLPAFLRRVPDDAASVHINWRGFGSSGRVDRDYGFVTDAFTRCAHPLWGNNHHFKTIARKKLAREAFIHDIEAESGRRLLSDFMEFETHRRGQSSRIVHDGVQVNHYQCKTFDEFVERMRRGDANFHPAHQLKARDASRERFLQLDMNGDEDTRIAQFQTAHLALFRTLAAAVTTSSETTR